MFDRLPGTTEGVKAAASFLGVCRAKRLQSECLRDPFREAVHRAGRIDDNEDRPTLQGGAEVLDLFGGLMLHERPFVFDALDPVGEQGPFRPARVPKQPQLGMAEHRRLDGQHPGDGAAAFDAPRVGGNQRSPHFPPLFFQPAHGQKHPFGDGLRRFGGVQPPQRPDDFAQLGELLHQLPQPEELAPPGMPQDPERQVPAALQHPSQVVENVGEFGPEPRPLSPFLDQARVGLAHTGEDLAFGLRAQTLAVPFARPGRLRFACGAPAVCIPCFPQPRDAAFKLLPLVRLGTFEFLQFAQPVHDVPVQTIVLSAEAGENVFEQLIHQFSLPLAEPDDSHLFEGLAHGRGKLFGRPCARRR